MPSVIPIAMRSWVTRSPDSGPGEQPASVGDLLLEEGLDGPVAGLLGWLARPAAEAEAEQADSYQSPKRIMSDLQTVHGVPRTLSPFRGGCYRRDATEESRTASMGPWS